LSEKSEELGLGNFILLMSDVMSPGMGMTSHDPGPHPTDPTIKTQPHEDKEHLLENKDGLAKENRKF